MLYILSFNLLSRLYLDMMLKGQLILYDNNYFILLYYRCRVVNSYFIDKKMKYVILVIFFIFKLIKLLRKRIKHNDFPVDIL
jgi:hypothetical protein